MAKRIYARSTRDYQNRITIQLEAVADRILNQMREQFARELKQQLADAIQNNDSASSGSDNGGSGSSTNTALFSAAFRYLLRPKAKISQQETSRSAAANQQFRQSQSQTAAEATAALARAQKNS